MNADLDDKTKKYLENLMNYLQDSSKGYAKCAQLVHNEKLKKLLSTFSEARKIMIEELQITYFIHGNFSGTLLGCMHRLLIHCGGKLSGYQQNRIIDEIKRGENILINYYKNIIYFTHSPELISMLKKQLHEIINNISTLDRNSVARSLNVDEEYDPVEEASEESFPASDSPAWIHQEKKNKN